MFHLEKGTLKQRIVQVLGNQYNAKLVTVQEQTDYLNIYGFVGKPETAKKTRGDQYFFVNNRFHPQSLPEPRGDERLPGNDRARQLSVVCIVH